MAKAEPNYRGGLYRKVITYQGKKYQITAKDEKTLMRKVVEKEMELESGNYVMNKNTTVERWIKEWLEVYKKPTATPKYYANLESLCRLHIIPEIGNIRIVDVKKVNLQRILNRHEDKSYSFVSKIRVALYGLFSAALEDELILKNPALNLSLPNCKKGESVAFTDEEYEACFEVVKTHHAGAWVLTMLTCGLRPQETIPLTWKDVNLQERYIEINRAADTFKNQPSLKETKSKAGNRIVPIGDELYRLLKNAEHTSDYLFHNADGGMMTQIKMRNIWKSFIRHLDIHLGAKLYRNAITESKLQEGLTPYSCRHTCITRLVLSGMDIKTVQVFAGHESAETTLKYYTHLDKHGAAKRILNFNKSVSNGVTDSENPDAARDCE